MLSFDYEVKTQGGEIQNGKIIASSKNNAISLLKEQGYYVLLIKEVKKSSLNTEISFGIPKKSVILFTKQLSVMLRSKITLIEVLGIIIPEIKNQKFQKKIFRIMEEIKAGSPFSDALKSHPKVFDEFYVALIKTGEDSGNLADSLLYLSKHLENQQKMKRKIISAMAYPMFILTIMMFTIWFLFLYMVPKKLQPILEGMGTELPLLTVVVIGIADFLVSNIIIIILAIILLIIGFWSIYKTVSGRYFFDKNILRIPLLGNLMKKIYMVQFIKNFTVSISSGLSIIESLNMTEGIISNWAYKKEIRNIVKKVTAGTTLSSAIGHQSFFFSGVFLQMLVAGERSGILKDSLESVSELYEDEIKTKINLGISFLEPIMMLFLGAVVLVIVLSVFLPILQITAEQR